MGPLLKPFSLILDAINLKQSCFGIADNIPLPLLAKAKHIYCTWKKPLRRNQCTLAYETLLRRTSTKQDAFIQLRDFQTINQILKWKVVKVYRICLGLVRSVCFVRCFRTKKNIKNTSSFVPKLPMNYSAWDHKRWMNAIPVWASKWRMWIWSYCWDLTLKHPQGLFHSAYDAL